MMHMGTDGYAKAVRGLHDIFEQVRCYSRYRRYNVTCVTCIRRVAYTCGVHGRRIRVACITRNGGMRSTGVVHHA